MKQTASKTPSECSKAVLSSLQERSIYFWFAAWRVASQQEETNMPLFLAQQTIRLRTRGGSTGQGARGHS